MSIKIAFVLILLSAIFLVSYACSRDEVSNPWEDASKLDEQSALETGLAASPEVRELISITEEITIRLIEKNADAQQIEESYRSGGEQQLSSLFGWSEADIRALQTRIASACNSLTERYPALQEMVEEQMTYREGCDIGCVAAVLGSFAESPSAVSAMAPAKCKLAQLTSRLVTCYGAGMLHPLFGVACAYNAYCSYCSGGLTTVICH